MKYEIIVPRESGTPFDAAAIPTYVVIAIGLAVSAILVPALGFSVAPQVWPIFLTWPFLAFSAMLLRYVRHERFAAFLEATALTYGQGLAFLLVMFPLTAVGSPLADNWLSAIDRALGFHWTAYAWAIAPVIDPLVVAYKSFAWQPLLVIGCLAYSERFDRLWRFVFASALTLLVTTLIYPFAPAVGAFAHYGLSGYPMKGDGPLEFGRIILLIRGGHNVISPDLFTGFVSFPSYHAIAAVLFSWAAWPTRLRYPMLALNALVVIAAPVVGGHYFIDILGGFVVAAVAIRGSRLLR